jgi:hypothetical protein
MEVFSALAASIAGFTAFHLTRHPSGKIGKKLPEIKYKRVEISPSIKLHFMGRTIWLHHWLNLSIILIISIFVTNGFLDYTVTKGFLVGSIIQGLTFPDASKVIFKASLESVKS